MPIAFDAATDGGLTIGGTSLSWSHVCTGSDLLLRVGVRSTLSATDNITGVTYDGVALTRITGNVGNGTDVRCLSLWELLAPTAGSHTVVVSGSADVIIAEAASYTGVSDTFDASNTSNDANTSLSVSVTPVADNCWVQGVFGNNVGDPSAGTGTTERVSSANGIGLYDNNAAITPATATAIQATTSGSGKLNWAAASIVPVVDGGGGTELTDEFYSEAGDGSINTTQTTWDAAHDATSGMTVATSAADIIINSSKATDYTIERAFMAFDVDLPADAEIVSAKIRLMPEGSINNDDNDGDNFIVGVLATPADEDNLDVADFDQCGAVDSPTEVTARVSLNALTVDVASEWTLNSTGLAALPLSGRIVFGFREGHDVLDHPIADLSSNRNVFYSSNDSDSQRPMLSITYTVNVNIDSVTPDTFEDGETGIVIAGTGF